MLADVVFPEFVDFARQPRLARIPGNREKKRELEGIRRKELAMVAAREHEYQRVANANAETKARPTARA